MILNAIKIDKVLNFTNKLKKMYGALMSSLPHVNKSLIISIFPFSTAKYSATLKK